MLLLPKLPHHQQLIATILAIKRMENICTGMEHALQHALILLEMKAGTISAMLVPKDIGATKIQAVLQPVSKTLVKRQLVDLVFALILAPLQSTCIRMGVALPRANLIFSQE